MGQKAARKIQPGDVEWICGSELNGVRFKNPVQVVVKSIDSGSMHPIKVQTRDGSTYYVSEEEFQRRAAKAEKKPANLIVPEKIKQEAEQMAEKKIQEFKEEQKAKPKKPTFEDICTKFYALASVGANGESPARDIVLRLAEKALFDEIKEGCVWE